MSNVIPLFPEKKKSVAFKIPLYGDIEVRLIVAIINMFGDRVIRKPYWCLPPHATTKNLKLYNPNFVVECLKMAMSSDLFSTKSRVLIKKILEGIEEVELTQEA